MPKLACQVCGDDCDESWPCVSCKALYYCSSKHRRIGVKLGHDAEECSRMQQQMQRAQEVLNFGTNWPAKTSSDAHIWLKQLDCIGSGLLQYSIPCQQQQQQQQQNALPASGCTHNTQQQQNDEGTLIALNHCTQEIQEQVQQQQQHCVHGLPQDAAQWFQTWAPLPADLVPSWPGDSSSSSSMIPAAAAAAVAAQGGDPDDPVVQTVSIKQEEQMLLEEQQGHDKQQQQRQQESLPPRSWDQYYAFRNIPRDSPAALSLHFPLTLWYCLMYILPKRGYKLPTALPAAAAAVNIICLGAQSELHMLAVFAELLVLLPGYDISIHMIGPEVPEKLHAKACKVTRKTTGTGSVTISCWTGCWHDVYQEWTQQHTAAAAAAAARESHALCSFATNTTSSWFAATPLSEQIHLVFAANAGLPAFQSWIPTLQQLLTMHRGSSSSSSSGRKSTGSTADTNAQAAAAAAEGVAVHDQQGSSMLQMQNAAEPQQQQSSSAAAVPVPVLFSDYCEEAAVRSMQMAESVTGQGFTMTPQLNPFRQPLLLHHGTKLPACSNGFLFGWV